MRALERDQAIEALYATGHWLLGLARYADAAVVFRVMTVAAPNDERSWLALGACHEAVGQTDIAAALYEIGSSVAAPTVRCAVAHARALRTLGRECEAQEVAGHALEVADELADAELRSLALRELRAAA